MQILGFHQLKFHAPTVESDLIQEAYHENKIKSHEINEICIMINTKLLNSLESRSSNLFSSLTRFLKFKGALEIEFHKSLKSVSIKENLTIFYKQI